MSGESKWKEPERSIFEKYAIILIEESKPKRSFEEEAIAKTNKGLAHTILPMKKDKIENLLENFTQILIKRIKAHLDLKDDDPNTIVVDICSAEKIIAETPKPLVPIMYRIATEKFITLSKSLFKIIQCPNESKLMSEIKPSLPEILIHRRHQVVVAELRNDFSLYNDFAYSVLRQFQYHWLVTSRSGHSHNLFILVAKSSEYDRNIRVPQSFFAPDDVCFTNSLDDNSLIVITPSMPDGDLEIPESIGTLAYVVLNALKASCMGALQNHLLMRDLRIGKFSDTLNGIAMIRLIYRSLQQRVKKGGEIILGREKSTEELAKLAAEGNAEQMDLLSSAQMLLETCNNLGIQVLPEDIKLNAENSKKKTKDGVEVKESPSAAGDSLDSNTKGVLNIDEQINKISSIICGLDEIDDEPNSERNKCSGDI